MIGGGAAVGSLLVAFIPELSSFVFGGFDLSAAAFGWLFAQLMIAEAIVSRFTKKRR